MARETCNLNKEEAEILKPSSPPPASPPAAAPQPSLFLRRRISPAADLASTPPSNSANSSPEIREVQPFTRRCSCCRRKVGLTGFRCRCGDLFCSRHRYSDCHDCSFDYKAAGREEIAKANPAIRASKIIKI